MGVVVLVATRDRPGQALATLMSFKATSTRPDTRIIFGLDHDEPQLNAYLELLPSFVVWNAGPDSGSLTKVTNSMLGACNEGDVIGSVGDDHRFRTKGWDEAIYATAKFNPPGVIYPNDAFQGANLATAFFAHGDVVRALGWLALPVCDHMYIDNAIMDIGRGLNSLHYLPNTIIEHLHPAAGKGIMDASYARTNSKTQMSKDELAYTEWKENGLSSDISRIREYLDGQRIS
jgi:hypothetical protein